MKLLIVESPHKAKTISSFLSKEYRVIATAGHIKNLPKDDYGIRFDEQKKHQGEWTWIHGKKKVVQEIKKYLTHDNNLYIATDDDREGERIASDLVEELSVKSYYRVIFHEITKKAVIHALNNSTRYVDEAMVESQKARRLIDRIIGYPVSQMMRWYFKKNGLPLPNGIGRTTAPALRLVCDRDSLIDSFVPEEYKTVHVTYQYKEQQFSAFNKTKYKEEYREELDAMLEVLSNKKTIHVVNSYKDIVEEIPPYPPLITSWLQRRAFYIFKYEPTKTMKIAQELYEGIDIGGERIGLITYIRTDSQTISTEAFLEIVNYNINKFGEGLTVTEQRVYKNAKNSQEAHEAIRPTTINEAFSPKNLKQYLTEDQYNLYSFIFFITVATQLKNALYDRSKVEIIANGNRMLAEANKLIDEGWMVLKPLLKAGIEETKPEMEIPSFVVGDTVSALDVATVDRVERRPARIGEGVMLTLLDNKNIGRPSTIATITKSLKEKGYIENKGSVIVSTLLGKKVDAFITLNAPWLNDFDKIVEFEEKLDLIAQGESQAEELIEEYEALKDSLAEKIGYVDRSVAEWKVEKVKELAKSKGVTPSSLTNPDELDDFYKKYKEKKTSLASCPICKEGNVFENDKAFSCSRSFENECNFTLWKSDVEKFLQFFQKTLDDAEFKTLIKNLLTKKRHKLLALFSQKKNKTFDADGVIAFNSQFNKYQIAFKGKK